MKKEEERGSYLQFRGLGRGDCVRFTLWPDDGIAQLGWSFESDAAGVATALHCRSGLSLATSCQSLER